MEWIENKWNALINLPKVIMDFFWNNLIALLILLIGLAAMLYIYSYFGSDAKLTEIAKNIALVMITGAVFQFILKSRGFLKVVDETLDHTRRQWEKYNYSYIRKLLDTIKEVHTFFEFDFNQAKHDSYRQAKEDYETKYNNAKSAPRTEETETLLRRNFFIPEIKNTRTIYRNGCEIVVIEADIDIIRDGVFSFTYDIKTSNGTTKWPLFEEYLKTDQDKRFSEFSFSARVTNLPDNIKDATLDIEATTNTETHKVITMTLSDTLLKGDTFTLMFSVSTKDEYSENFLGSKEIQASPPSSRSENPIGVRHFIIQEEHYGMDNKHTYLINPKIEKHDKDTTNYRVKENVFYKIHSWTIYYSEIQNETIQLNLV